MVFKAEWEKTNNQHYIPEGAIDEMAYLAYPGKKLIHCQVIAGGCSNLNFKIQFLGENQPLILRTYLQNENAAYLEQNLSKLLKTSLPIPNTYYIGKFQNYHFAITEFMKGITLRDLLLGSKPYNLQEIMYKIGVSLAKIAQHKLPQPGFFNKDLNIINDLSNYSYLSFATKCLNNETVASQLSQEVIFKIEYYLKKHSNLLSNNIESNLVHGDFDPANILVCQAGENWAISGILDWEFSFAGSILWDIANMLRYSYKMPPSFQTSFLDGLKDNLITLPNNWQILIHVFNLVSLLDCLCRSTPPEQPNKVADILELIDYILTQLDTLKPY